MKKMKLNIKLQRNGGAEKRKIDDCNYPRRTR